MSSTDNVIIETMGEQIAGLEQRITQLETLLEACHLDMLDRLIQTKVMLVALKLATGAPDDMSEFIKRAESMVLEALMLVSPTGPSTPN